MGAFLWAAGFGLGGLWADQALGVLGEYPLLPVLLLAVSPLRRVPFSNAGVPAQQKGTKRLCSCVRPPTPGSIPPLSLPMSLVRQGQEHPSLRSSCVGAAEGCDLLLLLLCGASWLAKAICGPTIFCLMHSIQFGCRRLRS